MGLSRSVGRDGDATYMRRGALGLGAMSIGGYALDYVFNLGLTRFLTPHDYGDFKVAVSFASFFGLAVLLGGDRAAPLILAPCLEQGESRRVWEYLRFYLVNASLLSVGLIVVTWTLSAMHVGSHDPFDHHLMAWAVLAVPLNAVGAMVSRTLQSSHRPVRAAVPWRIGLPLLQLALFGLIFWTKGRLEASEAVVLGMVAVALITGWQWLDVRRFALIEIARARDFRRSRAWLGASLPMMGAFLAALALSQSDLYFLELLGDESEVGHYAAASMAAHFIPMVQVAIIGLVAPLVGPSIQRGASDSRATFRRGQVLMMKVLLPIVIFLALVGEPILALFGPGYRVGHGVLLFLVVGNCAWAFAALPALWLQYQHRARIVLMISLATLVADSALNLVLIPRYGMVGAAAGTAFTLTMAASAVVIAFARVR